MNKLPHFLRKFSAVLILISGVTHLAQLLVYKIAPNVLGASAFGAIYIAVGLYLLRPGLLGILLGSYLPLVGGILGGTRYLFVHNNPFSLFHIGIDLIVVPICLYLLIQEIRRLERMSAPPKNLPLS
jgi:hypothetical protein